MKTWQRATSEDEHCGSCRLAIPVGRPMLVFKFAELSPGHRGLRRCPTCAGEPVPDDLPALEDRTLPQHQLRTRFSGDMLPIDFKSQAAGGD